MNFFIENLNQLGGQFLNFAWPMLWQSSLLITLVLAVDFSLARKLRASVRHALWLVVLVKLLLPPTLALPTGAAWWLFPVQTTVKVPAHRNYVVTYDNVMPLPTYDPPTVPFADPPPPRLERTGWTLLAVGAVSAGLLLWLLFRWAQVARMVSRASRSEEFSGPLGEARRLAGLRGSVRVRIVDDRMSPAVCGLFKPVILLPRTLAEKLSAEQLRAVLLHEAIHIRRKDIWVNCAQALLQVAYWWHPLVWVANARIRRVREEAVDDAVMLALDAEAEIYAPTLLEVARLALRRPLLSLGLVGILESRSALRQRIERLLAFRAPREAGLTLASLCGILAFSAVALPMGEGPARVGNDMAADTSPPLRGMTPATAARPADLSVVLVKAEIYQMRMEELKEFVTALHFNPGQTDEDAWWSASPEEFFKLSSNLKQSGQTPVQRPRIQTSSGKPAQFFVSNDTQGMEMEFDCLPVVTGTQVDLTVACEIVDRSAPVAVTNRFKVNAVLPNKGGMVTRMQDGASNAVVCLSVEILTNQPAARSQPRLAPATPPPQAGAAPSAPVFTGPGRQVIMAKLGKIHFGSVSYDGLPLSEVLKQLSTQCKLFDPEHNGINFLINNNPDRSGRPAAAGNGAISAPNLDPNTGLPMTPTDAADVGSFLINIPSLNDVRLADVLDAIVLVADHPIKYSVQDFAIVFSAKNAETPQLSGRTFRADPNTFNSGLANVSAKSFGAVQNNGSIGGGGGGGQNQNNGAVVGVVNAFGGAGDLDNAGQGTSGGGRLEQAAPAAEPVRQTSVTFRLNQPKPEAELRTMLAEAGVNLPPTRFIYNARAGVFAVHGAPDQLVLVNQLVLKLNGYSPQEIQASDDGFVKSLSTNQPDMDDSTNLYMRTFRVSPDVFYSSLENASGQSYLTDQTLSSSPSAGIQAFFNSLGVDLLNPPGKSVFFKDRLGYLFVKATKSDLDTIERALQVLNQTPPLVHIKARFYEVPKGTLKDFCEYLNSTNPVDGEPMGILTSQNANAARQALQSRKNSVVLGEPELAILSRRQAQIRATTPMSMVTGMEYHENSPRTYHDMEPLTQTIGFGPILDVVPYLLSDGYTISLVTTASQTEWIGYAKGPKNLAQHWVTNSVGKPIGIPNVWPAVQSCQASANVNLIDGQTLILVLGAPEPYRFGDQDPKRQKLVLVLDAPGTSRSGAPDPKREAVVAQYIQDTQKKKGEKEVIVFITPTIVDRAGSRVHSDDEMPFAQGGIPPQSNLPPNRRTETPQVY